MCEGVIGGEYLEVAVIDRLGRNGQGGTRDYAVPNPGVVKVDRCIAGHVRILNLSGVRTYSACCGHDDLEPPAGWHDVGLFGPMLRGAQVDGAGEWVPRARILIHLEDADLAFDNGYEPDVLTYAPGTLTGQWPPVLELQVPRHRLEDGQERPVDPAYIDENGKAHSQKLSTST